MEAGRRQATVEAGAREQHAARATQVETGWEGDGKLDWTHCGVALDGGAWDY